ncbi:MAG TPA: hypothetical protein VF530_23960 [Planctomycetota bacterium]
MPLHSLVLLALSLQTPQPPSPAPSPGAGVASWSRGPRALIPGTVLDLARDAAGRILYCTAEREVGRIGPGRVREVLATAASFPNDLRAVAESGADIVLIDLLGHVRKLPGGASPPVLVYPDQFMIQDPTDLIVDARGSFLIASSTPTSGTRAMNWIASDGIDWGYYRVGHQPLALAHDPLTGGILMSDASGGGTLRLVEAGSPIRALTLLDATTLSGAGSAQGDGDMAVTASGDVYWIGGGSIWLHQRATGVTALHASGFQQLRGIVIAAASPGSTHGQPWSLYVAEGGSPTRILELEAAPAPASLVAGDQGDPPGKGRPVPVAFGCQCLDLTLDQGGRLLLGGTTFVSGQFLKRITTSGTPSIATVASSADGLLGPVEGVVLAPDRSIYTLAHDGSIQHVTTSPLAVTTVFTDPTDLVVAGKDLAMDLDGTFYIASRDTSGLGRILAVAGGSAVELLVTEETRGLAARPQGGMYFSQWRFHGFAGTVDLLRFSGPDVDTLPGFAALNYSNDDARGDGEIVVDVDGNVYTISEDDWSLVRYRTSLGGIERIGGGYLGHPAGLAIALSTAGSGSSTGWSLYVAESLSLWEHPGCPPPASPWVDASLGLTVERSLAGAPHPRHGRPSALAPAPHPDGLLIATEGGWLLTLDTRTGAVQPVAGPEHGLRGELVAIGTSPDSGRTLVLNSAGEAFELLGTRPRVLTATPGPTSALLARIGAEPQRSAHLADPSSGRRRHFVLDGWAVWRVADEP